MNSAPGNLPSPRGPESYQFLDDPVQVGVRDGERVLLTTEGRNTDRVVFFSDAVFAIAMTLLVLDIQIPDVSDGHIGAALIDVAPKLLAFVSASLSSAAPG